MYGPIVNEYDDGLVACTQDALLIRRYYFPLASTKTIPYTKIRSIERRPAIRGRIWGTGNFIHWHNLDLGRPRKKTGLVLDLGRHIKPVITPENPGEVLRMLARHGVDVST